MPQYSLFVSACLSLITGVLAQGGGGGFGGDVQMVPHTNANIRYSAVANGLGHADCTRVPSPCASKWWTEQNEGGTAYLVSTRHATTGPGSSLSFAFSGSKQLILGGKRDSSVSAAVSLNGAPFPLSSDTDALLFSITSLNPSKTYNVVLNYGGHGTLGFAGFAVDKSARVAPGQALPAPQEPEQSHLPGPTMQPAPSNPTEPTKTPPGQSQKPTDTTLPPGSGSTSTSSKPKPSSDPAEGAQQPSDAPGDHDDTSPSSTRTAPTESGTAIGPDDGNSNAVTPPSGDDDENVGSDTASDQPGNAGAGSPQSSQNGRKKTTGAIVGGVVGAILALILLGALAAWYARRRVLARRAPSYAFRHGPGEFAAPPPHWTQRPSSPQPEMVEKPLQ